MVELRIDGNRVPLAEGTTVKRTIQANTVFDLSTRQTNYTLSFTTPLTNCLKNTLGMANIDGVCSTTLTQGIQADLIVDGFPHITEGTATVTKINHDKETVSWSIKDGISDIFDLISSKTIKDLGINIEYSLPPVDYDLMLADYGQEIHSGGVVNGEIPPSLKFDTLLKSIFTMNGKTINGKFLSDKDHTNLYLKTGDYDSDNVNSDLLFSFQVRSQRNAYDSNDETTENYQRWFYDTNINLVDGYNDHAFKNNAETTEFVNDIGAEFTNQILSDKIEPIGFLIPAGKYIVKTTKYKQAFLGITDGQQATPSIYTNIFSENVGNLGYGSRDKVTNIGIIESNNPITLYIITSYLGLNQAYLDFKIFDANTSVTNFFDKSASDVIKAWLFDYGLSLYKNPQNQDYYVYTLKERLQSTPEDWTKKAMQKNSSAYKVSGIGQTTEFKRTYGNEDTELWGDSEIVVSNNQLTETKIYTSKMHLGSKALEEYDIDGNYVQLINLSEEGLAWVRKKGELNTEVEIENMGEKATYNMPIATQDRLDYDYLIANYHDLSSITGCLELVTMTVNLSAFDIYQLQLIDGGKVPKLLGRVQIGNVMYFINRVVSFVSGSLTKVELIKLA